MDEQLKPTHISKETYNRILETVSLSLRERGFKATTMDLIASQLSMSKRTLYEIFENKDQMFLETIKYFRRKIKAIIARIFTQSSTVIEALVKVVRFHLAEMKRVNPVFFHDMDSYAKKMRQHYDDAQTPEFNSGFMEIFQTGVRQGVFREEINYRITVRLFLIQLESLKRAESNFPADISISEIYSTLAVNFLRSIATPKGLSIIDDYLKFEN